MTGDGATAALTGGVALLERAVNYTRSSLQLVRPDHLHRPTPCAAWDLWALLCHMDASLAALTEAVDCGQVDLGGRGYRPPADPVASVRDRACTLLGSWTGTAREVVRVGDHYLPSGVVGGTGALEIAVHGWDVAQACGARHPLPPALAMDLLEVAPYVVADNDRPDRFGPAVPVPLGAGPAERLLAFLGRAGSDPPA